MFNPAQPQTTGHAPGAGEGPMGHLKLLPCASRASSSREDGVGTPGMLRKAGMYEEESAEVDHGAWRPKNNCVLGKQFCSRGLFIGMFFLSTPFPHLLPFVLKGSWQIGKGLEAMHRKLWNTMSRVETDPHPPKKITRFSIQRPWGRQMELEPPSLLLLSASQKVGNVPKGVQNRVKWEVEATEQNKTNKTLR